MSVQETIQELELIRVRLLRLRRINKGAAWFGQLVKAIESLVVATKKSVEYVGRATKK